MSKTDDTVVLSEDGPEYPVDGDLNERVVARMRRSRIAIDYEKKWGPDEPWTTWQGMGASFDRAEAARLLPLLERFVRG